MLRTVLKTSERPSCSPAHCQTGRSCPVLSRPVRQCAMGLSNGAASKLRGGQSCARLLFEKTAPHICIPSSVADRGGGDRGSLFVSLFMSALIVLPLFFNHFFFGGGGISPPCLRICIIKKLYIWLV